MVFNAGIVLDAHHFALQKLFPVLLITEGRLTEQLKLGNF
jgi:hypothetical protein